VCYILWLFFTRGEQASILIVGSRYLQSPVYPGYGMTLHLPASQREFFLANAMEHQVEVRAQWYENEEEFAKTNADTMFNTRPNYLN
jgi:hypothetical protein